VGVRNRKQQHEARRTCARRVAAWPQTQVPYSRAAQAVRARGALRRSRIRRIPADAALKG